MLSRECRASLTKFLQLLEEAYGPHLDMENFDSLEKRWQKNKVSSFFVICKTIYEDRKGYMVDELQLRHLFHLFTNIKGQG
jgi:hypothetical protein